MRVNGIRSIRRFASRLRSNQRGLAMIEFAFGAPILVTLGLMGLETAQFAIANLRVTQMASIVADSASRVRDSIDESDVIDILTGAKLTGSGIKFAENGRIILSSLEPNTAGTAGASTGQWIRWQRCDGAKNVQSSYGLEDKGKTDSSLQAMGPPGRQIAAQADSTVMFVEIIYDYQPIVSNAAIGGASVIKTTLAFNVRQRSNQALTNTSNLSGSQTYLCTRYAA